MEKKHPKLTPLFSGCNPVRKGVYLADFQGCTPNEIMRWFAYWDGRVWGWLSLDVQSAVDHYNEGRIHRTMKMIWRGLAVKP